MTKKNVKPAPSKYFHEVMKEEQELLKLSYEESVRQREERKNKERNKKNVASLKSYFFAFIAILRTSKTTIHKMVTKNKVNPASSLRLKISFSAISISLFERLPSSTLFVID